MEDIKLIMIQCKSENFFLLAATTHRHVFYQCQWTATALLFECFVNSKTFKLKT